MNPYAGATEREIKEMLETLGLNNIDEIFSVVPESLLLKEGLHLPALDEPALVRYMSSLAKQNQCDDAIFAGGGIYDHYVPPIIDYLVSRGEFLTAYTPYQPEVSQGSLQAMFEYQSMICEITGMDVANSSLYDGATSLAEAVLMLLTIRKERNRILVFRSVHPQYREVLKTYLKYSAYKIEEVAWEDKEGTVAPDTLSSLLDERTACVVIQHPNFFGCLEDMDELVKAVHSVDAKVVVVVDAISLGLLKRPGDYGADVVVAEGQPLGLHLYAGGETLGVFACREEFLRYIPGRLVGMTTDLDGKSAFTLTLQTREQHIRRERATSNICTNHALNALRAAIYLALMGKSGFRQVAESSAKRAYFLMENIKKIPSFEVAFNAPVFREFTLAFKGDIKTLKQTISDKKVLVGPWISDYYENLEGAFLVALTEKRTREEMEFLIDVFRSVGK